KGTPAAAAQRRRQLVNRSPHGSARDPGSGPRDATHPLCKVMAGLVPAIHVFAARMTAILHHTPPPCAPSEQCWIAVFAGPSTLKSPQLPGMRCALKRTEGYHTPRYAGNEVPHNDTAETAI